MTSSLPRAVIFDWDNTLVDSWPAIERAMNETRHQFNLPEWSMEDVMRHCTRAARESFPEWYGDQWQKAYDIYYAAFNAARQAIGLHPKRGAPELLQWLKDNHIPSFVVSNKRGDLLRQEADQLKWQKYFVAVIGAQDATKDKPAREHVDHALKYSDILSDGTVWFVGDSKTDVECANNSSCTPVLIGTREEAEKLGVVLVFHDCQALLSQLMTIRNKNEAV